MRLKNPLTLLLLLIGNSALGTADANPLAAVTDTEQRQRQQPLDKSRSHGYGSASSPSTGSGVSVPFFASLERMARLVDITYCVGTISGLSPPFLCASRCKDFPTLRLVRTWNTGVLMSDSCGYIAVDRGSKAASADDVTTEETKGGSLLTETTAPVDDVDSPAIVVAFRGTYSLTNTIIDLSTVPQEYVPYPAPDGDGDGDDDSDGAGKAHKCSNCTVHMGFMASWRSAREVVLPALKEAREKHPGYPVHLVGHSLGGAVAALAALELRLSLGWTDVTVTTFGEPRIGNQGLVDYLDEAFGLKRDGDEDDDDDEAAETLPYRRITHVNDPVPLLPLTEWGFRSHAGEVFIAKADLPPDPADLQVCRGDEDPACTGGEEKGDWLDWVLGLMRGDEKPVDVVRWAAKLGVVPARLKLWQLFFAHRDYFWRLGLCVPGGDPADWGRGKYNFNVSSAWDDSDDL
ncbi:Alpha/Beta hydrolase protein [Lasiosphaeria miniovina]|uniref:Alpha/Beta hydrolase protein n=1 Tax=Lasiosphaeria miniovina TaxID=1954250 RepID=A0AA40EE28_9PEZI|nr:Alpha/Beta hydrolase protein [Lasiosphaeria miniovina]KAK0734061.1 Alpha/Beta hydrolase protein [Lasiosphaeria miniovina]